MSLVENFIKVSYLYIFEVLQLTPSSAKLLYMRLPLAKKLNIYIYIYIYIYIHIYINTYI